MNHSSAETRSRHIKFSSTVSETFVLSKILSEGLVHAGEEFWKSKGLTIKSTRMPAKFSAGKDPMMAEFFAEGGTIWTTNFDSYKKVVTVNLTGGPQQTEVLVRMVLPGGFMSMQDRERAATLIEAFHEILQTYNS